MAVTVPTRYRAHLQRGGLGVQEMLLLLDAYARHSSWESVRREALDKNLLGKTSLHQVRDLLQAFRRRFLSNTDLPPVHAVACFVRTSLPEAVKVQALLPYYLLTDALVERCYRDLVLPRLSDVQAKLRAQEVLEYLEHLAKDHSELRRWSKALRERWVRGFRALLRKMGLMDRAPSSRLKRSWLLLEPFAFFWLWLWERFGSFREVERAPLWELYLLDADHLDRLLAEGQLRGWWIYQRLGPIAQFHSEFENLAGWLQHGLGNGHG